MRIEDRESNYLLIYMEVPRGPQWVRNRMSGIDPESPISPADGATRTFSDEALAVLDQGRTLWRRYHQPTFPRKTSEDLKLNRPDVGWYQIHAATDLNNPVICDGVKTIIALSL